MENKRSDAPSDQHTNQDNKSSERSKLLTVDEEKKEDEPVVKENAEEKKMSEMK